jgi:cytochrome P450
MPTTIGRNLPPGPRFNPLSLLLRGSRADVLELFMNITREYGDVALMRGGPWSMYLVSHPNDVQYVLHDNHKNYTKRDRINALLKPVLGDGLLTSEGDLWRRQRRLMQPAFHSNQLASMDTVVTGAARSMLSQWQKRAASGQPLEILAEMRRLTYGILGRVLFGIDVVYTDQVDWAAEVFFDYFDYESRHFWTVPKSIPTPRNIRLRNALRAMDKIVDEIIGARERDGQSNGDLLSMLMLAEEKAPAETRGRQLRDEVATMIRVGYETPAVALAWTWYFLSTHPEVERKLRSEVGDVLNGRTPTFQDLPRLKYTRAVLEESMRLCPPVWAVSRYPISDDNVGGYFVPANSIVIVCPYITQRHPAFWENPEGFDPERFMPEQSARHVRGSYLPFGGGPRRCIGDEFAMIEAQLIIPMVVQSCRLHLPPGYRMEPSPVFTLRPRHGLPMTVHAVKEREGRFMT